MKRKKHRSFPVIKTAVSILLFFIFSNCFSQNCVPDHFFYSYQGNTAIYAQKTIITSSNELLLGGSTLKIRGDFLDATDGFITKFSSRGNILWSKRYYMPGFNSGGFSCIENATDSSYFAIGGFGLYRKAANGQLQQLNYGNFLFHLDKFGNVIWIKRIANFSISSFIADIVKVSSDEFIITGTVYSRDVAQLSLMGFNLAGNLKWHYVYFSEDTYLWPPKPLVLNNGNVFLCGNTTKRTAVAGNFYAHKNQGYYTLKCNAATGNISGITGLYVNTAPTANFIPVESAVKMIKLPNDSIAIGTSFSELQQYYPVPYAKEAAVLKIGSDGKFYTATAYYNTNPGCRLHDIAANPAGYTLLMDDGYQTLLAKTNKNMQITHQKGYGQVNGNLQGTSLIPGAPENRILFTGRTQVAMMGFAKTEPDGSLPCMETSSAIISKDISTYFSTGSIQYSNISVANPVEFEEFMGGSERQPYSITRSTDCYASCCTNISSDTAKTELCNATTFKLPDNSVVKETGLYYVRYITSNNCDSIAYYDVQLLKKPVADLGGATCLGDSSKIILTTTPGYTHYLWNGNLSNSHEFTVTQPGKYKVEVNNICGTAADEIEVFKDCNLPVYMPSAFTPNADGLNDLYGYSTFNKNKLISLHIYNRFGQLIFTSTDITKKWDGTFKNVPQENGLYIYTLNLKTPDKRTITRKGKLVLIR